MAGRCRFQILTQACADGNKTLSKPIMWKVSLYDFSLAAARIANFFCASCCRGLARSPCPRWDVLFKNRAVNRKREPLPSSLSARIAVHAAGDLPGDRQARPILLQFWW